MRRQMKQLRAVSRRRSQEQPSMPPLVTGGAPRPTDVAALVARIDQVIESTSTGNPAVSQSGRPASRIRTW